MIWLCLIAVALVASAAVFAILEGRKTSVAIVELLFYFGESYGIDLVRWSNGRLERGSIYVWLAAMERKGIVVSRVENVTPDHIAIPRRIYRLTELGMAMWLTRDESKETRS